jgi:hypothetical protein
MSFLHRQTSYFKLAMPLCPFCSAVNHMPSFPWLHQLCFLPTYPYPLLSKADWWKLNVRQWHHLPTKFHENLPVGVKVIRADTQTGWFKIAFCACFPEFCATTCLDITILKIGLIYNQNDLLWLCCHQQEEVIGLDNYPLPNLCLVTLRYIQQSLKCRQSVTGLKQFCGIVCLLIIITINIIKV